MILLKKNLALVIITHRVEVEFINGFILKVQKKVDFNKKGMPIYHFGPHLSNLEISKMFKEAGVKPGIIIFSFSGILCELYSYFGHAYVGGGHGRSVHSILEPYFAGARVYCGPKVHRSTEYEIVKENSADFITIIDKLNDLYKVVQLKNNLKIDYERRENLYLNTEEGFQEILSRI